MGLNKPNSEIDASMLENVQTTTNTINTTLGSFAGGGTDSVVTELNALKQAVAALTTKTDGLQENVTDIETVVNQIASGGSGSVIKHIQKDTFELSGTSTRSISLSGFSNLDKMIVLLYGGGYANTGETVPFYVYDLSLNTLVIRGLSRPQMGSGYYEVIEFY